LALQSGGELRGGPRTHRGRRLNSAVISARQPGMTFEFNRNQSPLHFRTPQSLLWSTARPSWWRWRRRLWPRGRPRWWVALAGCSSPYRMRQDWEANCEALLAFWRSGKYTMTDDFAEFGLNVRQGETDFCLLRSCLRSKQRRWKTVVGNWPASATE